MTVRLGPWLPLSLVQGGCSVTDSSSTPGGRALRSHPWLIACRTLLSATGSMMANDTKNQMVTHGLLEAHSSLQVHSLWNISTETRLVTWGCCTITLIDHHLIPFWQYFFDQSFHFIFTFFPFPFLLYFVSFFYSDSSRCQVLFWCLYSPKRGLPSLTGSLYPITSRYITVHKYICRTADGKNQHHTIHPD